jgi:predicted nucleic acid-binding protein
MRDLMRRYKDTPMDMADASLVAAAETLLVNRIFTLDKHFYAYRLADNTAFEVFP